MAEHADTIPGADALSELIDLTTHPDGLLLSLCASLMRLRAATMAVEDAIAAIPATTMLGVRMLECVR